MERIELGKITAPVGIKGEVRVFPYTEEKTRFSAIREIWLNDEKVKIENVRYAKNMVILKLSSLPDRNAAEKVRGCVLSVSREAYGELPDNAFFVQDLIGSTVLDESGSRVGILSDVIRNPAHDLYEIRKPDGKTFLLPAVKEFILKVDPQNAEMTIHLIEGMADL